MAGLTIVADNLSKKTNICCPTNTQHPPKIDQRKGNR